MNSKIKIYKTSALELSLQDCKALPFLKIDTGWDYSQLPWSFEVCLVQDIKNLWLLGKTKFSAGKMPDSPPNSYIEGLANFDLIEFFFAGKDARYSEYHVAPLGRWWMQTFTTPRQKDPEMHIANVIVESDPSTSNGWATSLKIPINTWMKNLGSEPISGNITATFRSQSTPLASLIKLPGEKPNFHQPTYFAPLEFIKLD